jgi:NADH:ubiquinone reductase (H+-translocating)
MTQPSTIAVLGGGYAGLFAAQRAARAARARRSAVRVVLIDADDAWTERTRWHQIAAGETVRSRPRARMFRGTGVENITATAAGIDLDAHTVTFTGGQQAPLPFDRLVYAAGSRSSVHLVPGAVDYSYTLDTAASSHLLAQALGQQPTSHLLVVGGGLTGIQTAAEAAERYPEATITLLSSGQLGHELPEKARTYIRTVLSRLGVEIMDEKCRVTAVEAGRVQWDDGELKADLIVWTAGFTPSGLARAAGLAVTSTGQVEVDNTLRSVSHPFVFAAGDGAAFARAASLYGAYAATATGATAGRNAARDLTGQAPAPLDMGYSFVAASVGQHNAVVQLLQPDGSPRRQMLTGRPAHWMKEAIERYVTFAARAERTLPGIYRWAPAAKK